MSRANVAGSRCREAAQAPGGSARIMKHRCGPTACASFHSISSLKVRTGLFSRRPMYSSISSLAEVSMMVIIAVSMSSRSPVLRSMLTSMTSAPAFSARVSAVALSVFSTSLMQVRGRTRRPSASSRKWSRTRPRRSGADRARSEKGESAFVAPRYPACQRCHCMRYQTYLPSENVSASSSIAISRVVKPIGPTVSRSLLSYQREPPNRASA